MILNTIILLSFMLTSVFLYKHVYILTQQRDDERFSIIHYVVPLVFGAIFCASHSLPSLNKVVSLIFGYGSKMTIAEFFNSGNYVYILSCVFYAFMSVLRIRKYNKTLTYSTPKDNIPQICPLITLLLALLVVVVVVASFFFPALFRLQCVIIPILHVFLVYNVVQRNYTFFRIDEKKRTKPAKKINSVNHKNTALRMLQGNLIKSKTDSVNVKKKSKKLEKRVFEAWINSEKPYLNPDLKITDVCKSLGINRTYISSFINVEYGVNFNQYINMLRFNEVERIMRFNKKSVNTYSAACKEAGFGSYRSYLRAKEYFKKVN